MNEAGSCISLNMLFLVLFLTPSAPQSGKKENKVLRKCSTFQMFVQPGGCVRTFSAGWIWDSSSYNILPLLLLIIIFFLSLETLYTFSGKKEFEPD